MNYGYGICGHKNSFSTNALLGNYVEDQFGRDLASNPSRGMCSAIRRRARPSSLRG